MWSNWKLYYSAYLVILFISVASFVSRRPLLRRELLLDARQALLFQELLFEALLLWHGTGKSSISLPPLNHQCLFPSG